MGLVSYGGIYLPTVTPEAAAWVEANLSAKDVEEWQRWAWPGNNRTLWASAGFVTDQPVKLGSLYWPTGATRWAIAHYLINDDQWGTIKNLAYPGTTYKPLPLVIDSQQNGGTVISPDMWMLPSRFEVKIPNYTGMYLLTLVDDRYFWQVRSTQRMHIDEGTTTWEDIYTQMGSALGGITIDADDIPAAYGKPGKCLNALWEQMGLFLDAVAYNVGQRIVRGLDGTVRAMNVTTSQAIVQSNLSNNPFPTGAPVKAGGVMLLLPPLPNDSPGVLPESVTLTAVQVTNGFIDGERYPVVVKLADLNLPEFGPNPTVQVGNSKVFHDGIAATITTPPDPDNLVDLQALTRQVATDWYRYQISPLDIKFAGIAPWVPEGWSDSIEWLWRKDEVSTRVQRGTWNDLVEELCHAPTPPTPILTQPFPAALTAVAGTAYSWRAVIYDGAGEWSLNPAGPTGTFNAYERNTRPAPVIVKVGTLITHNCVVWMYPEDDGTYEFDIELESFPAHVFGLHNPYTFVEEYPPGTTLLNGRTGFCNEMNGVPGAGGKHVEMFVFKAGGGNADLFYFAWESSPPSILTIVNTLNIGSIQILNGSLVFNAANGTLVFNNNGQLVIFCPCGSGSGLGSGTGSGGGISTGCCPGVTIPQTLNVSFSGWTGDCSCLNSVTFPIVANFGTPEWGGSTSGGNACGPQEVSVSFACDGTGNFNATLSVSLAGLTLLSVSCSPFQVVFGASADITGVPCHGGSGQVIISA